MKIDNEISAIRKLIRNDELPQAIVALNSFLDNSPQMNEVILHSAKYNDLAKQIRLGVIDSHSASIYKNQIRISILELLSEIETYENEVPKEKFTIRNKYWMYFFIATILIILIMIFSRNEIIGIRGNNNDNNTINIDNK